MNIKHIICRTSSPCPDRTIDGFITNHVAPMLLEHQFASANTISFSDTELVFDSLADVYLHILNNNNELDVVCIHTTDTVFDWSTTSHDQYCAAVERMVSSRPESNVFIMADGEHLVVHVRSFCDDGMKSTYQCDSSVSDAFVRLYASHITQFTSMHDLTYDKPNHMSDLVHAMFDRMYGGELALYPMFKNTDSLRKVIQNQTPDTIVGLAAGLYTFAMYIRNPSARNIVIYDILPESILYWQLLLEHWDGSEATYEYVVRDIIVPQIGLQYDEAWWHFKELNLVAQQFRARQELTHTEMKRWWTKFRKCNFTFTVCDIINEPEKLGSIISTEVANGNPGRVLLWYSNVFRFAPIFFKQDTIACYSRFEAIMKNSNYDLWGVNPNKFGKVVGMELS